MIIPTEKDLQTIDQYNINTKMCYLQLPDSYINDFMSIIDTTILSKYQTISEKIAKKYYNKIDWDIVDFYNKNGTNNTDINLINKYKKINKY